MKDIYIDWYPQPRQMKFMEACGLDSPYKGSVEKKKPAAKVIGYGGAAGGGKSDSLLNVGIVANLIYPGVKVGYFRRTYSQLEGPGGAIMRSHEIIPKSFATYNGSLRRWTFPGGGIIQFCYCQHENDVYNYQSQQFDIILFDESTQFTRFQYRYLMTRNRATIDGFTPFAAMATNPGNVGHTWFKKEFVSAGEHEAVHEVEVEENRFEKHIFIPAKLSDNRKLTERDPEYEKNLDNQPEHIRRMLKDGDWDVFAGQAFEEWNTAVHVVNPFSIPKHWRRWISVDNGFTDPYAWLWFAVDEAGTVYCYREFTRNPDKDPKIPYSEQAKKAVELSTYSEIVDGEVKEVQENIYMKVAGHDAFSKHPETEKSIIDYYREGGMVGFIQATTDRRLRKATIHEYLKIDVGPDGKGTSKLKVFNCCKNLIEQIPQLICDEDDPEKVAECDIDHIYDSLGYGLIAHHMNKSKPAPKEQTELERHKANAAKKTKTKRLM